MHKADYLRVSRYMNSHRTNTNNTNLMHAKTSIFGQFKEHFGTDVREWVFVFIIITCRNADIET